MSPEFLFQIFPPQATRYRPHPEPAMQKAGCDPIHLSPEFQKLPHDVFDRTWIFSQLCPSKFFEEIKLSCRYDLNTLSS